MGPADSADPRQPCDLILAGGTILTLDATDTIVADGAVAIRAGRIAAIGRRDAILTAWRAERVIACEGRLLMPGLVNVHNHTPLMITRGMIEDLGFAPMFTAGIPQGHRLSEGEAEALSRLGVYEMLRNGCTTIMDFYRYPQALARAHADLGSRAVVAGRVHDADPEALTQKRYDYSAALRDETIRENADLIAAFDGHDGGRIRCDWAPHAPDTCSDEALREVAALAAARGRGNVHTHLCQSTVEVEQVRARSNMTPPQALAEAGLLNPSLIAAHCIHVDPSDYRRLGEAGIAMAYTPIGNAKTGRIAPAFDLAEAGVAITLCTDTFSGDLFEAMRWAVSMQRIRQGRTVFDARTALRWATQAGADRLGLGHEVGSLAVGKQADILVMDTDAPTLAPLIDGYGILVYGANGMNVRTVLVGGRLVVEDGVLATGDGPAIVREAQAVAERLWGASGRRPIAWPAERVA